MQIRTAAEATLPPPMKDRLARVFFLTEEENRQTILRACEPKPGATVLDLGCGDGAFTARVAEKVGAARTLGVEGAPSLAEEARANGVEVEEVDLAERLPYDDASIDVVVSNQVIEHLPDTDTFMREIGRVVAPGGYAVVSTNNLASWHNVASLIVGWQPMPNHVSDEVLVGNPFLMPPDGRYPMHRRVFTGKAMAALAEHHGLKLDLDLGAGWYPLGPKAARHAARWDRRHAAFLVQRYRPVRVP